MHGILMRKVRFINVKLNLYANAQHPWIIPIDLACYVVNIVVENEKKTQCTRWAIYKSIGGFSSLEWDKLSQNSFLVSSPVHPETSPN